MGRSAHVPNDAGLDCRGKFGIVDDSPEKFVIVRTIDVPPGGDLGGDGDAVKGALTDKTRAEATVAVDLFVPAREFGVLEPALVVDGELKGDGFIVHRPFSTDMVVTEGVPGDAVVREQSRGQPDHFNGETAEAGAADFVAALIDEGNCSPEVEVNAALVIAVGICADELELGFADGGVPDEAGEGGHPLTGFEGQPGFVDMGFKAALHIELDGVGEGRAGGDRME